MSEQRNELRAWQHPFSDDDWDQWPLGHFPGGNLRFICGGCLGHRTLHHATGEGHRCEGCGRLHVEKVAQDLEQENVRGPS